MGKIFPEIDSRLRAFMQAQHVFFVATAPSGRDGHVNCSPKGLDSFRVLDPTTVAYLDFVGSGAETIAHLRDNGRIVLMFCAFDGPPKIVRLHGRGTVVAPTDPRFSELIEGFVRDPRLAVRAVLQVSVTRISDSCGYGIPVYRYQRDRDQLPAWSERKGAAAVEAYKRDKNTVSIDGLPALDRVPEGDLGARPRATGRARRGARRR